MVTENEVKINARGLSAPGPRLMAETALQKGTCRLMRVVVSDTEAVDDLRDHFTRKGVTVKIDQVGEEFHVLLKFEESQDV
jgi:TusA-related sulfurtransferase